MTRTRNNSTQQAVVRRLVGLTNAATDIETSETTQHSQELTSNAAKKSKTESDWQALSDENQSLRSEIKKLRAHGESLENDNKGLADEVDALKKSNRRLIEQMEGLSRVIAESGMGESSAAKKSHSPIFMT